MHPIAARIAQRRLSTLDTWKNHFPEVFAAIKKVGESANWIAETADEARMTYRMPKNPRNPEGLRKLADILEDLVVLTSEVQKAHHLTSALHQKLAREDA